jgi:precorrin-6A synthase
MRRILTIGIGAGDPRQLTLQAIDALNQAEVVFIVEKGEEKRELADLRRAICARHVARPQRTVELDEPRRDREAAAYGDAVHEWRSARADLWANAIHRELGEDGTGAFLVWGDPAFYDSTIAILDELLERHATSFTYEVIPGISAIQILAARHRIALNRIGGAIHVTTGRRLAAEGIPVGVDDVVVMLDAHCAFTAFAAEPFDLYWGAYLGTPDELLRAGPVGAVADEVVQLRADARARKGWIMDTYLLRRRVPATTPG